MTEAASSEDTGAVAQSKPPTGVTLSRPMIVSLLYVFNIMVGFSVVVGVVLAYVWRVDEDTEEWEKSHYTYLIRTFWIGLVAFVVTMFMFFASFFTSIPASGSQAEPPAAFFLTFFGMFIVWMLLAAWFLIRSVMSLARSGNGKPMPKPRTWLF